ncbi:pentapeptide repeat-containing protein [Rhodobacteraceae bacterium NNCM2]|nr:pentapeptide repeat-containing protein [Coraliihabitans acroporae]
MDPKENYRPNRLSEFYRETCERFSAISLYRYFRVPLILLTILLTLFWFWLIIELAEEVWVLAGHGAAENAEDQRNIVQGIALAIAAIAGLLSAPIVLYRIHLQTRQTETAEQGHITDRINKAVEQLGAEKTTKRTVQREDGSTYVDEQTEPNLEVRLGAIYALERIAQDSLRDHIQVMEILCAYIRNNAPASEVEQNPLRPWPDTPMSIENTRMAAWTRQLEQRNNELNAWINRLPEPRVDVQAAIRVIGRRRVQQIEIERKPIEGTALGTSHHVFETGPELYHGFRLDLRNCCLRKADLSKANLNHAQLNGALLEGANLHEAKLKQAYMTGTRLDRANLHGADFERALLTEAKFERADLSWANFERASLRTVKMVRANLTCTRFHSADLSYWICAFSSMPGADFTEAKHLSQEAIEASFGARSGLFPTTLPEEIKPPSYWYRSTKHDDPANDWVEIKLAYQSWLDSLSAGQDADEPA